MPLSISRWNPHGSRLQVQKIFRTGYGRGEIVRQHHVGTIGREGSGEKDRYFHPRLPEPDALFRQRDHQAGGAGTRQGQPTGLRAVAISICLHHAPDRASTGGGGEGIEVGDQGVQVDFDPGGAASRQFTRDDRAAGRGTHGLSSCRSGS